MSSMDANGPCTIPEYALGGPQVEPEAAYWNHCPRLRMVSIDELTVITDDSENPGYFPPYPDPCSDEGRAEIVKEMTELTMLQRLRDDPDALVNDLGATALGEAPCDFVHPLPKASGHRAPVSRLLDLQPRALGAVQVDRLPGQQVIRTGRGMARAVEAETPGLFHRHALDYLITTRSWSPARQALVWAALDVALASALQAAWYYKWLSPRERTSRRERPIEYSRRHESGLTVLFDGPDELNPRGNPCPDLTSPGTPRHPAYPSGHSTYAGAASTVLAFFFGNDCVQPSVAPAAPRPTVGEDLRRMADNIGMGRLWAGIHWRSDHEAGLRLGQVVGCLVLRQVASICGGFDPCGPLATDCDEARQPRPREALAREAEQCRERCRSAAEAEAALEPCPGNPETCRDVAPEQLDKRSVQQGAV